MEAYSVVSSATNRATSRIWQDWMSCRAHHVVALSTDRMTETQRVASRLSKRRAKIVHRKPHIGVVGAGLAGLRCADILLKHGFEVTLIEARNRLGGRVNQHKLSNGHLVDCGPNWIHGTNDNPILDIANETRTAAESWDTVAYVLGEDGEPLTLADEEVYSTMMWDIIQGAFAHSEKNSAMISPDESLWDFFQEEVVKRIPHQTPDFETKRQLVFQLAETWGAFVGSPILSQSLKFFWLEECIDGENLFCAGTYRKILEAIAKPAVDGARIRFSTSVTKVNTTDVDDDKSPGICTESGEIMDFDEIVFTAPLGWLKQNMDAFRPTLPARMSKAIQNLGYGCLEKVYISFPKAFWLEPDSRGRKVQGFCQWLSPNYATDLNPQKWNQEIVELASLGPESSQPTLLFYTYGDQSKYITQQVALRTSREKKDEFLYDFFQPYYSRMPHYDKASPDCQPVAVFSTDWLHDDLAGNGSYTNFQVGLEEGDQDVAMLRDGLPDRGLWFAGEHTAPFVALGTATGAYWSGESVGKRIAEAYGRGKNDVPTIKSTV